MILIVGFLLITAGTTHSSYTDVRAAALSESWELKTIDSGGNFGDFVEWREYDIDVPGYLTLDSKATCDKRP